MQSAILSFFLLALVVAGVLGSETRLLFFWPGCALLGLVGLAASVKWRWRVMFQPNDACLATVLLFSTYIAARAWLSPVEVYLREDLFIVLACVIGYVFTATVASHPRWRLAILAVLLVLAIGNLALGSIHLSGRWDFHVVPSFARAAGEGRIGGFFPNPNHLAAFLSMALFMSAAWLCFGRGGATLKLWMAFMSVSMAIGMALTVSRGALLGAAAGGLVFALLALWIVWETQRHLFWRLLLAGLMAVALGGAVLWKVNEEYLRNRMVRSPMSTDVRLGIWEAALAQHAQSPVVGAGARMFYDGSIRYRSPNLDGNAREALFAHNEYLQLMADYGWVGLGLLALMILVHLANGARFLWWFVRRRFLQTGRVASSNLAVTLGALAAVAAALLHAAFEFQFHIPIIALTAALLLGFLANPGFESDEFRPRRLPGVRASIKLAMLAAALACLAGAWFFGRADYQAALAGVAEAKNDTLRQIGHLDAAIEIDARNAETFYRRGLARLDRLSASAAGQAGNPVLKRAVADLERAVALNPHNYLHRLALADGYDLQGRHDEALDAIHQALILAPLHEEPRIALGLHWHRLGNFEQAEMAYLWASRSLAWNEPGTANWLELYRQLVRHSAPRPPR